MEFLLESYDYALPQRLIATHPVFPKENAKLLVYTRSTRVIVHMTFAHLLDVIPSDSLVVLNDTRVLKARIYAHKLMPNANIYAQNPKRQEIFFHRFLDSSSQDLASTDPKSQNLHEQVGYALCQVRGKVKKGDMFALESNYFAKIESKLEDGYRICTFYRTHQSKPLTYTAIRSIYAMPLMQQEVLAMLESIGNIPLPPYIKREANAAADTQNYQSVFAKHSGAVAAPTASLHFSPAMLKGLHERFNLAYLTLHIGAGTFAPVYVKDIRDHKIHTEILHITSSNIAKILESKRVLCIGTSTLRSVEYLAKMAREDSNFFCKQDLIAKCDMFLHIGNPPTFAQHLLTNFHLPKSTLTMLVASMVGIKEWRRIYDEAIAHQYRFYSYGDGMLIV